jgi:hypothetical protein
MRDEAAYGVQRRTRRGGWRNYTIALRGCLASVIRVVQG